MSTTKTKNIYSDIELLLSEVVGAPVRFSEVGKRMKEIRGERNQEEFAHAIGVEHQRYISSFENGKYLAKNASVLRKVASLDPHKRGLYWLLGGDSALQAEPVVKESPFEPRPISRGPTPPKEGPLQQVTLVWVPLLDCDIAASPGHDTEITTKQHEQHLRWVPVQKHLLHAPHRFYRLLRVRDGAMEPMLSDHSLVLINCFPTDPRKLVGKPVAVWRKGDIGATIALLEERKEVPTHWVLRAVNPQSGFSLVEKNEPRLHITAVEAVWREF